MISQTYSATVVPASTTPNPSTWISSDATTAAFMENFARVIRRADLSSWWRTRGCWKSEISRIESNFDVILPGIYVDFLRVMGRSAGAFLSDTRIFISDLTGIRPRLKRVLDADGGPFHLPKETFVFASRYGDIFYFFDTADYYDDPPIFAYKKGSKHIHPVAEGFSTFLLDLLELQRTRRKVKQIPQGHQLEFLKPAG